MAERETNGFVLRIAPSEIHVSTVKATLCHRERGAADAAPIASGAADRSPVQARRGAVAPGASQRGRVVLFASRDQPSFVALPRLGCAKSCRRQRSLMTFADQEAQP